MKNYLSLYLSIFFLLPHLLLAQADDYIYGRLIDSNTKEGIPFASIQVQNLNRGVVTNDKGGFSIPRQFQQQSDTLILSCIGYETKFIALDRLKEGILNTIALKLAITAIEEVVITGERRKKLSAYKITKRALKAIPNNYPHEAFSYVGYYRDYQKQEDTYLNLNEAIVEVQDPGFHLEDREASKIQLLQHRTNEEFERIPTLEIGYDNADKKYIPDARIEPSGGNELSLLMVGMATDSM